MVFTLWALVIFAATAAHGQESIAAAVAFDSALIATNAADEERTFGGHGLVIIAYERRGLPRSGRFLLEVNTDTIRVHADRFRLASGQLEVGGSLVGQAIFAGLLPAYYRELRRDQARGFQASYVGGMGYIKWSPHRRHFAELALAGRAWRFGRAPDTASAFDMPPHMGVFEPRLRYTFWGLSHDAAFTERHRLTPRVRGVAFGGALGLDVRSRAEPWGARDADAFSPRDLRNNPGQVAPSMEQWLQLGWQATRRVRLEVKESTMWTLNGDDLMRARVGGMNPYAVEVPGLPWAAYLVERYVAASGSVHIRVHDDTEVGVRGGAVRVGDAARTGASDAAWVWGAGVFADIRIREWQVELRAGISPKTGVRSTMGVGGMFAVGYMWRVRT